jgi:hypothetical protein
VAARVTFVTLFFETQSETANTENPEGGWLFNTLFSAAGYESAPSPMNDRPRGTYTMSAALAAIAALVRSLAAARGNLLDPQGREL